MIHQAEFGLVREQQAARMRVGVERARLEARLRSARREDEARARAYSGEPGFSGSRRLVARGAALAVALFR